MKVQDSNLRGAALNPADLSKSQQAERARSRTGGAPAGGEAAVGDAGDGIQLSGLARQLQALGAESPEREARVEELARQYGQGAYRVDPEATAKGILDDALRSR